MPRSAPLLFVVLIASLSGVFANAGEPAKSTSISRNPPPVYEERLKQCLTDLNTVRALPKAPFQSEGGPAVETLLDETITFVAEDGREITVIHEVRMVLTQAGVKRVGEASHSYRPSSSRIHLVLAQSVRADGSVVPVEEKGAFIKRAANDEPEMHTDEEELRIVFPEVNPGVLVESIVVHEIFKPTIEGAFLDSHIWGGVSPTRRQRLVIDVPESIRAKLRWQGLGFSQREPESTTGADGRTVLQWTSDRIPALLLESGGPPPWQVGPQFRMGTLASWNAFGEWFWGLVKERDGNLDAVKGKAAEWAAKAETPQEIVQSLYSHVCSDIRYTGLEFGTGNYQPRAPVDVLTTCYGDCKDKANLLRALLSQRGIRSRIALLDVRHAGVIDRTIPSPNRFNHAILAIDLPGASDPLFCDPTIEGAPLGVLSPGSTDRDALLVDADGAVEWRRTPVQSLGRNEVTFDFQMEPGGGYSGWFSVEGDGYLSARIYRDIARSDRATALKRLTGMYCSELKGAEVIDYEITKGTREGRDPGIKLRAYVLKQGAAIDGKAANERQRFPVIGLIEPRVGPVAIRQTPIMGMVIDFKVSGTMRAPKGWKVTDLPGSFQRETNGFSVSAKWSEKNGTLNCQSIVQGKAHMTPPAEHRALWELNRDLVAWLDSPALFKRPAIVRKSDASNEEDEEGLEPWVPEPGALPKMATAHGQLALVDKRYPLDVNDPFSADHASRRKALAKVLEYFPDDARAQYQSGILTLASELMEFEIKDISQRARALIEKHRSQLDPESLAAGELMLASALAAQNMREEALLLALSVADNEAIAVRIRQGAAIVAAALLEGTEPERALKLARFGLECRFVPQIAMASLVGVALTSLARLDGTQPKDIIAEIEAIIGRHPNDAALVKELMVELPEGAIDAGYFVAAERMISALDELLKAPGFDADAKELVERARKSVAQARSIEPIREKLLSWLKEHPWPDLDKIEEGDVLDLVSELSDTIEDKEVDVAFRYSLRRMVHYGPQPEFADHLTDTVRMAEGWLNRMKSNAPKVPKPPVDLDAVQDALMRLAAELPDVDSTKGDILSLQGKIIERREGAQAAIRHYRSMADDGKLPVRARSDARWEASDLLMDQHDYSGVLAEWREIESLGVDQSVGHLVFRGIYLALMNGDRAEAWRRIEWINEHKPDFDVHGEAIMKEIAWFLANRSRADQWWERSTDWWKQWEVLSKKLRLERPTHPGALAVMHFYDRSEKTTTVVASARGNEKFGERLWMEMEKARWHHSSGKTAVILLRDRATVVYPKDAAEIRALSKKLDALCKGR